MSDEFRDLLKHRADEVQVPAGDLNDVIRGGNARKWRNRTYSVAVVVLVAVVGWATVPGIVDSLRGDDTPRIANTPTPTPTPTQPAGACDTVQFRPTYLPDGWSYELQESDDPNSLGRYSTINGGGGSVEIYLTDGYYRINPGEGDPIRVMGSEGQNGTIHEGGLVVEFTYRDGAYSLSTYTEANQELRRIAAGLRSFDECDPAEVNGRATNLEDGRHFGYIRAIDSLAVEFDVAEMLSGNEANAAAIEAGAIEEGDTVPNDYFIVNDDEASDTAPLSNEVEVLIDTTGQDGQVGPAPADVQFLVCTFSSDDDVDGLRQMSPWWITVKNGVIVKIEQQYLP